MKLHVSGVAALALSASLAVAVPAHAGTVTDRAAAPTITATPKSVQVEKGGKVVIKGKVSSRKVKRVALQQKRPGSGWKVQGSVAVKANGTYKIKDKPTTTTLRTYRVVSVAGPKAKSPKVRVGVYAWRDLTKMEARSTNGLSPTDSSTINGTKISPAISSPSYGIANARTADYNVNGACVALRAQFGLDDSSDLGTSTTIEVIADDVAVYAGTFGLTQSATVTVPLGTPFRVGLRATPSPVQPVGPQPKVVPVIGKPQIFCTTK